MIARFVQRLGDDTRRASMVGAYLFFAVAATSAGKAARDALFLSRFTAADLTAMDAATTLTIAVAVWIQLRLRSHLSTRLVLGAWPLTFAAGDAALCALVPHDRHMLAIAFLWVGVQACFCGPHAALLAARLLTGREARRRCAIVGGGAILGWMAGGAITRAVAIHAGAVSLLLADALMTTAYAAIAWLSWPCRAPASADAAPTELAGGLRGSAAAVWQSRHLRAIASIAFLSAAVTTIAGLQFRAIASQSIHDPNLLAAFFGTFSLRAGLLALACQVLLTTRVLNWIGAGALAIAPSLVGAASLGLWWSGTLTAATVLKGADHTVRYSIDRSALDTLYRPLTEHEVLEGKTVIDALVSRWGDTAGALMALLGTSVLHMQVRSLASMSVVLLAPWLVAVFVVNREYRGRLIEVLRTAPAVATSFCSPSVRPRGNGIRDPDPAVRLATLQALTRSPARRRGSRRDRAELHMILDAEIVALAVLADAAERGEAGAPTSTAREGGDTMARIARLLFLTAPDRYPTCLFGAVDGDGRLEPAALDYLDAALDRARRRLLVSAIERWKRATAARN